MGMTKEEFLAEAAKIRLRVLDTQKFKALARQLTQPFTTSNSGYRKLMYATHQEHALNLLRPEIAYISTGHETKQGKQSSYLIEADEDLVVISKISKFAFNPDHHYYLLLQDQTNGVLKVVERISYRHCSESTGFFYNNQFLDSLIPTDNPDLIEQERDKIYTDEFNRLTGVYLNTYGYDDTTADVHASDYANSLIDSRTMIHKGTVVKKSTAFDDQNMYRQGINLLTLYLDKNQLIEDPVQMSKSAAEKFSTPTVKPVSININENDILIDIHGDGTVYKPLPDIGEIVEGNQLYCLRRQVKEDCLYTQSRERLRQPIPSDECSPVKGMVVDIDVHCNNIHALDSEYNQQIKFYWDNQMRFANEMIAKVDAFRTVHPEYKLSHDLENIYETCSMMVRGVQYIKDDKPFNNMRIDIVVVEHNPLRTGDKVCNRFGGKGVVASIIPAGECDENDPQFGPPVEIKVVPDELMPRLNGKPVEMIWRSGTGINRENVGQYKETCLNNFSSQILDKIRECKLNEERIDLLYRFYKIVQPKYGRYLRNRLEDHMTPEEIDSYFASLCSLDCIPVIFDDPIEYNLGMDEYYALYEEFPFIIMPNIEVPIKDCRGNIRFVQSNRPVGVGHQYIYRLKQYAEEKYSETSLSTVNIKGDNAKSTASKEYKELHKKTAIRMGHMENDSLSHIGTDAVVNFLMLYSVSPTGRLHAEDILVGDPFNVDLKLSPSDRNRKVETYKTRFEAMGLELVIDIKKREDKKPVFPLVKKAVFPLVKRGEDNVVEKETKDAVFPLVKKK